MPDVSSEEPFEGALGVFEKRLWSALGRSVGALERCLTATSVGPREPADRDAAAVRDIAETMDRLGLLKPPPVEAPGPAAFSELLVDEVWVAARETGLLAEQCHAIVDRLRERAEGRCNGEDGMETGVWEPRGADT